MNPRRLCIHHDPVLINFLFHDTTCHLDLVLFASLPHEFGIHHSSALKNLSHFRHYLETYYFQTAYFSPYRLSASDSVVINGALQMYLITYFLTYHLSHESVPILS